MTPLRHIIDFASKIGCEYRENEPLSAYTTFKIGGPAELMLLPSDIEILSAVVKKCHESGIMPFVLGSGSNLLIPDGGLKGVTLHMAGLTEFKLLPDSRIRCMAGGSVTKLCLFAQKHALSGLEFAYGIPGSVGGALYMNAGAYGGEFSQATESCRYLTAEGELKEMAAADMSLEYRHSVFQRGGMIITGVTLKLTPGDGGAVRAKMDDFMGRRRDKQPLNFPSAGSAFKRPEGHFAGELIERCGLKGRSVGGARVSEKHAGFIVNTGGATAEDVMALIELVRKTVLDETGILLEPEVKIIEN
ncbi:MAG: UDP-N-acetylmuramate dehydrogenase [Oscillospiraceae bacterium]|nr:UDP-N-acetylmuramate dehydrogenase [Oscillospiraceae bacterium]